MRMKSLTELSDLVELSHGISGLQGRRLCSSSPLRLIATDRNRLTERYAAVALAPAHARIVAVGSHFLPATAAAWISDCNEITVAVEADASEAGREILIRIWTRDSDAVCRAVMFCRVGDRAVAGAVMTRWDGLPVAGLVLMPLHRPGEEQ